MGAGDDELSLLESPLIQAAPPSIIGEVKTQISLAGPLVAINLLQYCLQVISLMFVGHLGELSLSGASMATSFANVSGFSVLASKKTRHFSPIFLAHLQEIGNSGDHVVGHGHGARYSMWASLRSQVLSYARHPSSKIHGRHPPGDHPTLSHLGFHWSTPVASRSSPRNINGSRDVCQVDDPRARCIRVDSEPR